MTLPVARPLAHSRSEVVALDLAGVPLLMPRYSLTYDIGLGSIGVDAFAPSLSRRALLRRADVHQALGIAPLVIGAAKVGTSLFHFGSSKNADLAEVDRRYAAAVAGNPVLFADGQTALQSLLSGAGRDPAHPGGFATAEGRSYSYQKYQQAVAQLQTAGAPIGIMASGGGLPAIVEGLKNFFTPAAPPLPAVGPSTAASGPVGPTPGGVIRPTGASAAGGFDVMTLVWIGLGAFVLSKVVK